MTWPTPQGGIGGAVMGLGTGTTAPGLWDGAALAERLPNGEWHLSGSWDCAVATRLAIGFGIGHYRFTAYKAPTARSLPRLVLPCGVDPAEIVAAVESDAFARDLINRPANDLGPAELGDAAEQLAQTFGGSCARVCGPELERQYPLIAAVGRASARAPQLIDLQWGDPAAPQVTLVGKGVCFDSGGLDIKTSSGMQLMKKDMGGAACALAVARTLMARAAPLRLRVLIAAVENSISGSAYRPGDVWRSRHGLTVEIGNTDAEGRLVLADALSAAGELRPALLVDFATLTGAARVALGPELPAVFSNDPRLAEAAVRKGTEVEDPCWQLPLWSSYDEDIASKIADVNNVAAHGFAGAIIAALFLRRFVAPAIPWLHFDLFAWNARERPGRPIGAEPQGVRAVYALIRERFG
ncbi:MAG: leucyl aminopeptidase family protein [Steroidobacteraceae bacterium]|nr:leucyl aminopeptidase family protein [Steroidobacteraceae bacterium]MDW8259540.1 leucyl aminopeptidase family protein [Gammaproteobacteria bacterium]